MRDFRVKSKRERETMRQKEVEDGTEMRGCWQKGEVGENN